MQKMELKKRETAEIHGERCDNYIHIKNKGDNLFLKYMEWEIDIAWLYRLIEINHNKIHKKI